MVLEKAKEGERLNVQLNIDEYVPRTDPKWDPNRREYKNKLKQYQQLILFRVKYGLAKPRNVCELYEI